MLKMGRDPVVSVKLGIYVITKIGIILLVDTYATRRLIGALGGTLSYLSRGKEINYAMFSLFLV